VSIVSATADEALRSIGRRRSCSAIRRVAASATILLNVTLMAAVGTLIVHRTRRCWSRRVLCCSVLAKVLETGRGPWWLAVGRAVGAALVSNITAAVVRAGDPDSGSLSSRNRRRWLVSLWPYLGALVAFALFAPVILWNAEHQWVSFIKPFAARGLRIFVPLSSLN